MSIELAATIRAELHRTGVSEGELLEHAHRTFHESRLRFDAPASEPPPADVSPRVELGPLLGRGGMGAVYRGTQRSLGRPVAVKTLREDAGAHGPRRELLREALVTGAIEHPNVVPVHDLETTADGRVLVILKHVEGVPWSALIHDAEAAGPLLEGRDRLEWNVEVLARIANAVRYAHSLGFIHRDLKPDNVLVGRFGEVYLADWGIAVRLEDDGTGRFPLARDAHGLSGTPAYMAPEMLGGRQGELSPRTDVYLLGALLCEILAGAPPHAGESLVEILEAIERSTPTLPDDADPELAAIVRRAMAAAPADRFEDVEAFLAALSEHRSHRHSARLTADADARRKALVSQLFDASLDESATEAYRQLGETRFAYQQALATWPENPAARRGLAQLLEAMIDRELALGRPRAAATLLSEHPDPSAALRERVAARQREAKQRQSRLGRLEAEFDPSVRQSNRYPFLILMGILCSGIPIAVGFGVERGLLRDGYDLAVGTSAALFVLTAGLIAWTTRRAPLTAVSRRVVFTILAALGAQVALCASDWVLGSEPQLTLVRLLLVYGLVLVIMALHYTAWLLVAGAAFLACHLVGLYEPGWRFYLIGVSSFVFAVNMLQVRRWALDTYGPEALGGDAR